MQFIQNEASLSIKVIENKWSLKLHNFNAHKHSNVCSCNYYYYSFHHSIIWDWFKRWRCKLLQSLNIIFKFIALFFYNIKQRLCKIQLVIITVCVIIFSCYIFIKTNFHMVKFLDAWFNSILNHKVRGGLQSCLNLGSHSSVWI
jgi:hypothetical protein